MTVKCPGCDRKLIMPNTNPPYVRCGFCKTTFKIEYTEPPTISDVHFPLLLKAKRLWKKHKRKIIAGGIVVAAAGTALYMTNQSEKSSDNPSEEPKTLPPDLSGISGSVTSGLQDASTILTNACANAVAEIAPAAADKSVEDAGSDLSDWDYLGYLVDHCYNCGGSLRGGEYISPWEDGSNEYGYWICPHCGAVNEDWNSMNDD